MEENEEKRKTLSEVVQNVRNLKIGVDDNTILKYINEIEADIQRNVFKRDLKDIIVYDFNTDQNTKLIVPYPFYDLYEYYVMTMINFELQEFTAYNQYKVMYEDKYGSYRAYLMNRNSTANGYTKFI